MKALYRGTYVEEDINLEVVVKIDKYKGVASISINNKKYFINLDQVTKIKEAHEVEQ